MVAKGRSTTIADAILSFSLFFSVDVTLAGWKIQGCHGGWLNFVCRDPMRMVWRPFPQASCIPFPCSHLPPAVQLSCKLGGSLLTTFASASSPVMLIRMEDGAVTDTTFMSTKAALNACPITRIAVHAWLQVKIEGLQLVDIHLFPQLRHAASAST